MKKAVYKVPGGKLLKIFLEEKNGLVESIRITGDFFVHPEESIEELEKKLVHTPLTQDVLRENISSFFHQNGITVFGMDIDSLTSTILSAMNS